MDRRQFLTAVGHLAAVGAVARATEQRPRAVSPKITLAALGDCILTRKVSVIREERFTRLVQLLRDADCTYANCEMTFFDVRRGSPRPKGRDMNLVCETWGTDELAWMGIDIMGQANHHTMDYGDEGLIVTAEHLDRVGIAHAGAGLTLMDASRPAYCDTPGGRVALVNCASTFPAWSLAALARDDSNGRPGLNPLRVGRTYRVDATSFGQLRQITQALFGRPSAAPGAAPPPADELIFLGNKFIPGTPTEVINTALAADAKRITEAVAVARRNATLVLVTIHAHEGGNSREVPATFLQPFARACIDAGADAFFGAGPHLLRGIEIYRGKPICYSLGNFFFQYESVKQIPAEVFEANQLDIHTQDPSVSYDTMRFPQDRVYWESVVPVVTHEQGRVTEIRLHPVVLGQKAERFERGTPVLASSEEGRQILAGLVRMSEPYGTAIAVLDDGTGVIELKQL